MTLSFLRSHCTVYPIAGNDVAEVIVLYRRRRYSYILHDAFVIDRITDESYGVRSRIHGLTLHDAYASAFRACLRHHNVEPYGDCLYPVER